MKRLFLMIGCVLGTMLAAQAQSPGIDPRGLAKYSAPVVIGVVEGPWRMVIRPDKLPKIGQVKPQGNGTYTVELPRRQLDYMVGYIFRVRVQEVLKPDREVRTGQTIQVFAPFSLEGGVSLPPKQRFLLALAGFSPKDEDFKKTSVLRVGQALSQQGESFDVRARYYVVSGNASGAVAVTDKNRKLIQEIRAAVRTP
jgi:hypothetical protein